MIGVIVGLSGFSWSLWFLIFHANTKFQGFWDPAAAVLLGVGPLCVILMSHSFLDFLAGLKTLMSIAFLNKEKEMNQIANQLSTMTSAVRNEGVGILVRYKEHLKNPMLKDGVTLILSGFTPEEIKHNLTAKINTKQQQFTHASSLFENLGKLCPGMGLLGTICGLVNMLSNMNEPTKLGPSMAVALLTTFYGLLLGTVVYTPISEKITIYAEKMLQLDLMILEGVLLLKEKKSQAHLRDVLSTYSNTSGQNGGGGMRGSGSSMSQQPPFSRSS
ncbi:MAG: flagellar motor protein MotP [Pseudomonadota bacterium]|jgi:chemotaxis protein MotA